MISTQNILLNIVAQVDLSKDAKSSLQEGSINLSVAGDELKKDASIQDNSLDPNAFLLMLGQVFSNLPEQKTSANLTPEVSSAPVKQSLGAEILTTNSTTKPQSMDTTAVLTQAQQNVVNNSLNDQQNAVLQQIIDAQQPNSALVENQINDNPAVSWIDSQSFKSLTAVKQELTSSPSSNKPENMVSVIAPGTQNNASPTTVNTPQLGTQQPQPSSNDKLLTAIDATHTEGPANALPNEIAPAMTTPSPAPKEELLQSLQQLGAGVIGAATAVAVKKADVSVEMPAASNNSQVMATQSPSNHVSVAQTKHLEIQTPVTNPQWNNKLSEHIVWLGQNEIKSAVIKINPEDLGPLEISVKVVKDLASVNIVSHSAQVRDLVDQALPRLREMMSEQGLRLSDVQVNTDERSNQFTQNSSNHNGQQHEDASAFIDPDDEVQLVSSVKKGPKGLVDYFA